MALILSRSQVSSVISMSDCIDAVEKAFKELAFGTATLPTRVSLSVRDGGGWLAVMPAHLAQADALATKIVSVYANNRTRFGIPNVLATIVLNDVKTGRAEAVLEGSYVTAMRTGAVSGVATKYLSRQDSKVLGIFGAGVQAVKQLEAVSEVRELERVIVFDTDTMKARAFVAEAATKSNADLSVGNSATEVVQASDIIVTATTSETPVLKGGDIIPGTHINAIGAFTPTTRELDNAAVSNSKIVVDSLEAALAEAGDLIIPLREGVIRRQDIWAELGDIITERKAGRTSEKERTLFKSVGLGIQDAAVAKLAFERARSRGIGTEVDLD
jgi:ornithine cyclodeaminase/alanine dehydrogenase